MTTDFSNKINILAEFYTLYREEEKVKEFFEFNDIGLPLAWLSSEGLCEIKEDAKKYIAETWDIFLSVLDISEDEGFESLDEIMVLSKNWPTDQ